MLYACPVQIVRNWSSSRRPRRGARCGCPALSGLMTWTRPTAVLQPCPCQVGVAVQQAVRLSNCFKAAMLLPAVLQLAPSLSGSCLATARWTLGGTSFLQALRQPHVSAARATLRLLYPC